MSTHLTVPSSIQTSDNTIIRKRPNFWILYDDNEPLHTAPSTDRRLKLHAVDTTQFESVLVKITEHTYT